MRLVTVARKPLIGTVSRNALKYGTGGLNIDGSRIGTSKSVPGSPMRRLNHIYGQWGLKTGEESGFDPNVGRWPANLILVHDSRCENTGTKPIRSNGHHPSTRPPGSSVSGPSGHSGQEGLGERFTNGETVAAWECVEGCPVKALDEQGGVRTSDRPVGTRNGTSGNTGIYGSGIRREGSELTGYGDTGTASRFFKQIQDDSE